MRRLNEFKNQYESIEIPKELNTRIQQEINHSKKLQEEKSKNIHQFPLKRIMHVVEAAAAAVCILFTAALNTSPVFASGASQLPIIGSLAKILTFRSYETSIDDIAISVDIPSIEMIEKDTGIEFSQINQEILHCCNQYVDNAIEIAKDYRTAFLETGGTPEEWASHNIKITVNYEIKQQTNDTLSFIVRGSQNWSNAYTESKYYNLDLTTGKYITLKDLLGDNFMELVNESIRTQISERQKSGEIFFSAEEGGFKGISENTKFYINEKKHPVIVFEKYEIAPGSSGEIEFEIG